MEIEQFLIAYANFGPKEARMFVKENPAEAADFAHKLKIRMLADKGISEETKEKLTSYEEI